MRTSGARLLLCSIALTLSACGSAAAYDYDIPLTKSAPPLATMHAQLDKIPSTNTQADLLRVALVWFPVSPSREKSQSSQNLPYVLQNVVGGMEIDISQPPPYNAVEPVDKMRYAQGELVLYEDLDNDKELDVAVGFASHDRILGRANGLRVWWLREGMPASPDERGYKPITPGWSYTHGPIKAEPDPRDCGRDPDPAAALHPRCDLQVREQAVDVSPNDRITISVVDDNSLQNYACRGFWGTGPEKTDEWPDTTPGWSAPEIRRKIANEANWNCQDCPLDLPVAGRTNLRVPLSCNPDKTTYVWKDCEPDPSLCDTVFCHTGVGSRNPNEDPPPGWPDCDNVQ